MGAGRPRDMACELERVEVGQFLLLPFFGLLLFFPPVHATYFTGPVVSVRDGGTIEVLYNTYPERVCLSGIDCHLLASRLKYMRI